MQVNVTQHNDSRTVTLPGYVIKLNDPAPEPKTIENRAEVPMAPPREGTTGNMERDVAREKAELAEPRPSRG